jgi:hypothetical protein
MTALFENNQRNDVIRVATYRRYDFDVSLIRSPSDEHNMVRSSIAEPFSSAAPSNIGLLQRLPVEIL